MDVVCVLAKQRAVIVHDLQKVREDAALALQDLAVTAAKIAAKRGGAALSAEGNPLLAFVSIQMALLRHATVNPRALPSSFARLHRTSCQPKMRISWIPIFVEIGSPGKNL